MATTSCTMTAEAEAQQRHRSPPTLTAESIIALAQDPSATLSPAATPAALLSLLGSPSSAFPVTAYLSAILSLLSRNHPFPSLSFISSLLLCFLRFFHSRHIPRRDAASLFRLFAPYLSSLDRAQIPSLLDLVLLDLPSVADPDDALPLDLLPSLLNLAGGSEVVDQAFERLLSASWSKALLLKVVTLLRELPALGQARVSDFLEKVFLGMKEVDIQDLPSLVYQLLLLASKGISRKEVIRGILRFFGGFSKGPPFILRQVEGTILMHFNFAVKQDPSLGQEVLTVIRSDLRLFNHFAATVLFSVARVRRFNESSIDVLRMAVVASHRDHKISRDSEWLPDNLKEECLKTAKCVEQSLLKAVNECNSGKEHAVPSIVQFGYLLLENVVGERSEQTSGGLMSIEELSILMLKTLFEIHEMSRNEILEQCKFRILSLKPQKSMPIIELLNNLVQSYPYPMLEYIAHLKEMLDYFSCLQESTAIALVDALLPLVRFSCDFQDYIILVVRKAMFNRQDTVRIAATVSLINLISVEYKYKRNGLNRLQESSSQASCSQQADVLTSTKCGLFQELSGLLRRCLFQQATVKETFYEGLIKLVILEPSIRSYILDILWPHFLMVYKEENDFPLQLDACIKLENGKFCQSEPLDHLLSCVSWILLQSHGTIEHKSEDCWPCFGFSLSQENEVGRATSPELFSNALFKIRKNFKNFKMQGAEGRREDSNCQSLYEDKLSCNCQILLGVIEVLINLAITDLEKAEGEEKIVLENEIMEFSELYDCLEKESNKNTRRTGNRKGSSSELLNKANIEPNEYAHARGRTFFTTSTVCHLLLTAINSYKLCSSSQNSSQKSNESSRVALCLKMISFGLKVCFRHLKLIDTLRSGTSVDPFRALLCGDIKCLGKPIMQLVWLLSSIVKQQKNPKWKDSNGKTDKENKGDQLFLSLLCLHKLFKMNLSEAKLFEVIDDLLSLAAVELHLQTTGEFVEGINQEKIFLDEYQQIRYLHLFLEKVIEPLYSSLFELSLFRECEVLADLLLITRKKLPPEQRNFHGSWVLNICKRKLENSSAARSVISLALYLIPPTDLNVAHDMGLELLKTMGSEGKDPEERSEKFPVINQSTKDTIASVILQVAESCLVDLDWAVSKIKAVSACNREQFDLRANLQFGDKFPGLNLDEVLYSRSQSLVYLLSSFVEMNLKDSQAEQLLKVSTRFYKILVLMTKLQIAPKGFKQFPPSQKFQKLTEVTCTRLTSPLYNFVALVQKNQQENMQRRIVISKIKRENRCIPDLIFQIENYEKNLIQLSKQSKLNLLRNAKRSTSRDFKILEKRKVPLTEAAQQHDATPSPSTSENESGRESEGLNEENMSKNVSPEPSGDIEGEETENDKDDQEMLIKKKRAKMNRVVEDSDEEP